MVGCKVNVSVASDVVVLTGTVTVLLMVVVVVESVSGKEFEIVLAIGGLVENVEVLATVVVAGRLTVTAMVVVD